MTALIVVACILLFFIFILSLRATVTVEYSDEVRLSVKVLFLKIKLLPKKKKSGSFSMSDKKAQKIKKKLKKKAEKKRLKKQSKKQKKEQEKAVPKQKKSLEEMLELLRMIKDIVSVVVKRLFKHLRIKLVRFRISVATGDAATTAIAFGAICEAVTLIFPLIDKLKGFDAPRTKDVSICADYLSDSSSFDVKLSFSIRVWHVFHIALGALGTLVRHLVRQKQAK